jgi:hypothetical protein
MLAVARSTDRATTATEGLPLAAILSEHNSAMHWRPAVEAVARSGDRATTWSYNLLRSLIESRAEFSIETIQAAWRSRASRI